MAEAHVEQVKTFFHGYAKSFDGIYMSTSQRSVVKRLVDHLFRKSMYERFRRTLKEVSAAEIGHILDVGCGPGRYCVEYLKLGKKVTGVDLADGMLQIARKICSQEVSGGQYEFLLGDYLTMSFSKKFDAAVLMGLFDYIADPVTLLKKLRTDTSKIILGSFPMKSGFLAWQRRVRYRLRGCPLYLYDRQQLKNILQAAGMERYEITKGDREYFVKISLQ